MLKSLLSAALGAASLAAAAAAFLHFGDYVILSPDEQNFILFQFRMLQGALEACQMGM